MVAVPPHAAADVQQDLVEDAQHGRDLVGDDLGGVVVARRRGRAASSATRRSRGRTRASRRRSSPSRGRTACPRRRRGCTSGRAARRRSRRATRPGARAGPCGRWAMSFMPSGIQTLVTHGVPRALPKAAPIFRQTMPWSIQNLRMAGSGWASVKPSAALGWAK